MNKKIIFIITGTGAAIIIGFILFYSSQQTAKFSGKINTSTESSQESMTTATLKEYTDPAGFKFSYPGSVSVSSLNTTDPDVYSALEITSSSKPGKIKVDVVSSDLLTLDTLIASKSNVTDIKLADLSAKQYTEKGNVITVALDQGVLFTVTVSSGGNVTFWNEINGKLVSSFAFKPPETAEAPPDTTSPSTDTASDDSDVSFEGEETIE